MQMQTEVFSLEEQSRERGDQEAAVGLIWNQYTVIMVHFCLTGWCAPRDIH